MSEQSNRYIIAYDIADDRRRGKIAKHLESLGFRAQYSVFVLDLRPAKMIRLKDKLDAMIESSEDSIMVCRIGPASTIEPLSFEYLGQDRPEPPTSAIII